MTGAASTATVVRAVEGSGVSAILRGRFLDRIEDVIATRLGAPAVKLCPGYALGPRFVRAPLVPFPRLRLVPTVGVTLDPAREFGAAGAWAVGVGGPLVSSAAALDALEVRTRAFVSAMRPGESAS